MEQLSQHIESLIFTSQGPITFAEIKAALEDSFETKFKKTDVQSAIDEVLEKYKSDAFSFEIVEIANGFQFFTKGAFHGTVGSRLKLTSKKRLSKAALETLAVIAYKQPVIKSECEKIRGVSCDYTIQKLLEKELISISGRAETPGRPLLYSTSQKFMDYFGLKDITDLPKPKDFKLPDEEIGDAAPIEELSEEQREKRTIALEEMTDEVAAAILGDDFLSVSTAEEVHALEEHTDEQQEVETNEETIPEAAIDDEPMDNASEENSSLYYAGEEPETHGENVSPMSEEEAAALLASDALIDGDDDDQEEVTEEEEEAIVLEIEEDLKEIIGDISEEEEGDANTEFEFGVEVDAIAAMQGVLVNLEHREQEVTEDTEEEPTVKIPAENTVTPVILRPAEFNFISEIDAIATMEAALPEWVDESEDDKGHKMVVGLPDEELLSSTPIIDKIIDEKSTEDVVVAENDTMDISPEDAEGSDDSMKKKL